MIMRLLFMYVTVIGWFVGSVNALPHILREGAMELKIGQMVLAAHKIDKELGARHLMPEDCKNLSFAELASLIACCVEKNSSINLYQSKSRLYWCGLALSGIALGLYSFVLGYSIVSSIIQEQQRQADEAARIRNMERRLHDLRAEEQRRRRQLGHNEQQIREAERRYDRHADRRRRLEQAGLRVELVEWWIEEDDRLQAIRRLLQLEMHQVMPAAVVPAADYRQGVDVHNGNRDVRTRDAYRLLRERHGDVAPEVIDREFAAFNHYLEQFPDQEVRDRARRALYAPGNPWPGLCAGDAPQVEGLNGRQIIARLWMFADGVADQALAREGIIRALADSYEGNRLVCGPGMRQRLAVRVLQGEGRLAGVDIDGIAALARAEVARPVPTHVAVGDFFGRPAHQGIDNLVDLQQAAERYLRENNRVDRAGFMQQIQEYARQQEFV